MELSELSDSPMSCVLLRVGLSLRVSDIVLDTVFCQTVSVWGIFLTQNRPK